MCRWKVQWLCMQRPRIDLAMQRCQVDDYVTIHLTAREPFASYVLACAYGVGVDHTSGQAVAWLIVAYYTSSKKER